jgi:glycosyltransferase involved in cell wall biosynthesis
MGNTISVCMIAKNEEKNIKNSLECARKFADEIIVVDTGSEDATPEIARSMGAKVYFFPWRDDFSAARNESLKYATCDWILWLDADDVIDDVNIERIKELKKILPPEKNEAYLFLIESKIADGGEDPWYWYQLRMFPNHKDIKFEGRIHEQVVFSLLRLGIKEKVANIKIVHTGYNDKGKIVEKIQRNLRLLEEEEKKENSFWVKRYLAFTYAKLGRIDDAIKKVDEALEIVPKNSPIWVYDLHMIAYDIKRLKGNWDEVMRHLEEAEKIRPDEGAINIAKAEVFFAKKEYEKSFEELDKARKKGFVVNLIAVAPDSLKKKYYLGMARVLYHLKRYKDSLEHFKKVFELSPNFFSWQKDAVDEFVDCAMKLGEYELAYKILKSIEDKLSPYQLSNLAFVSEVLQKLDEAREYYKKAYEGTEDENPSVIFNYAQFEFMYGDKRNALELFTKYLGTVEPSDENKISIASALTCVANILLKAGEIKSSVEILSTACEALGVRVYANSISDLAIAWIKISELFKNDFMKNVAVENAIETLKFAPDEEKEVKEKVIKMLDEKTERFLASLNQ